MCKNLLERNWYVFSIHSRQRQFDNRVTFCRLPRRILLTNKSFFLSDFARLTPIYVFFAFTQIDRKSGCGCDCDRFPFTTETHRQHSQPGGAQKKQHPIRNLNKSPSPKIFRIHLFRPAGLSSREKTHVSVSDNDGFGRLLLC